MYHYTYLLICRRQQLTLASLHVSSMKTWTSLRSIHLHWYCHIYTGNIVGGNPRMAKASWRLNAIMRRVDMTETCPYKCWTFHTLCTCPVSPWIQIARSRTWPTYIISKSTTTDRDSTKPVIIGRERRWGGHISVTSSLLAHAIIQPPREEALVILGLYILWRVSAPFTCHYKHVCRWELSFRL